jgi:hypothetical protein
MDENKTVEAPLPELDERAIARKYGLRELSLPDSDQIKTLISFLDHIVHTGRCGPLPRTTVVVILEFLQATLNRQHITKGPRMSAHEFDALQTPYYVAARVISKIQRTRQEESGRAKLYQTTHLSLIHFIELLRNLLDPSCFWLRHKAVPDAEKETMAALREFLLLYPEQRRKGRAT